MEERKKYGPGRPRKGEIRPPKPAPEYRHAAGKERPHVWIIGADAGSFKHSMYHPWQKAKAQASFRGEEWTLSFEEFYDLWKDDWDNRGRDTDNICMTREDFNGTWSKENTILMTRGEHLKRQNYYRSGGKSTSPREEVIKDKKPKRSIAYAKMRKS